MADRYWVGGTANWDGTAGTKWALTSGGAGGQAVPTSVDDVYFDATSGAVTCTISAGNTGAKSINCTGFTGTITHTTGVGITVAGSVTLVAGMTFNGSTGVFTFIGTGTLITSGKTFSGVRVNGGGITVTLGDALTTGTLSTVNITNGTFTTNNFAVTSAQLNILSGTNTINLGSSVVTLSNNSNPVNTTITNTTFNAGTSQINVTGNAPTFAGGGLTFYNVSFTNTSVSTRAITGANIFNNLAITAPAAAGVIQVTFANPCTINGTLSTTGTAGNRRVWFQSSILGLARTLTINSAPSLTDTDFRDIAVTGTSSPVSGTRLGDCKGNSGITFDAAKTVYWNLAGNNNWSATGWAASSGGTPNVNNFPLAQDTAVFEATSPGTGTTTTVNAAYNIGTINMSARTSNTMTLAVGSNAPFIYGNWINGTGTTLTGTGTLTFAGRGSQTITSAGRTFTQAVTIDTPGGSVTLQDAYVSNRSVTPAFALTNGTFAANGYNLTLSGVLGSFSSSGSGTRTVSIGSGTWTIAGSGTAWNSTVATNLTVTGTGTISLTSVSAKTFDGGGVQTYPTLSQGGTGTLTIAGSNKFANITNTAIGRVQFTGGTTNEFTAFNLNGVSGNLLQVGSTNTTQVTLKAPSWNVGANSTNAGNNTGLSFIAGSVDYLSISYINGVVISGPASSIYYGATNVTTLYYGSTPVTAIYYGATQVY